MTRVSPSGCLGRFALTLETRTGLKGETGETYASVGSVDVCRTKPSHVPRAFTVTPLETLPVSVSVSIAPVRTFCA